MNTMIRTAALATMFLLLPGCADSGDVKRLVYAKSLTVGVNVSTLNGAAPDITLGVRSQNLAIVPVYDESSDTAIRASVGAETPQDADALSVFGKFSADTSTTGVKLGEFFATGVAAQKLADGVACEVSEGKAKLCK